MATFFTDRDLGKRFPLILRTAGIAVEAHHDHFAPDAEDDEWIPTVAARGWVALTHNHRIRYTPNEIRSVFDHGLALLVVAGHSTTTDLAHNFVRTLPRVERFLDRHVPPYIAKVYRAAPSDLERNPLAAGHIEMWCERLP